MKNILALIALLSIGTSVQAVPIEGQITPGTYIPIAADANGNLLTAASTSAAPNGPPPNLVSTVNSTVVPLAANGVFTGTVEDISKYSEVRVSVFSNVASATDGLSIQQSKDGTNWDTIDTYTIPASTGKTFGIGVSEQFFRIVYTNGGTIQTSMRMAVVYHGVATKPSAVRPQDGRSNDNDFEEVAAYNSIFNGVSWDRMQGSNGVVAQKPYGIPANDWNYAAAAGGITNTTVAVTMKAAAGAGLKNYITGCQLSSTALGAATEIVIRDGAAGTVIWRSTIPLAGVINGLNIDFPVPLRGTAATLTEVATLTASITGSVYINCNGYVAP
jgi:hypothetical protein